MLTKEKLIGHITPQATPIISHEVRIGETWRCTNNLQQIPGEMNVRLKMQTHRLNLDEKVGSQNLDRKLCWN